MTEPHPRHICGPQTCGGTFECPGCEHEVGWCEGANDMPELCNDCWLEVTKKREDESCQ